eukprot:m.26074 g.26074  ORF g.26074 m.26074 type:complete len:706 (-) comp6270_c0_seq1:20-2137(-)
MSEKKSKTKGAARGGVASADKKDKARKGKGKADDAAVAAAKAEKKQRRIAKQAKAVLQDDRFKHILSDKRFKPMPKKNSTVKIGKRFEGMFTSEEFSTGPAGTNELRRYYHTEEDEVAAGAARSVDDQDAESMDEDEGPESQAPERRGQKFDPSDARFAIDYSRGEVLLESSSEEEDEPEEEDGGVDVWLAGQPDQYERVELTEAVGRRLAICNLDWTNISAADLFVLANSFKPEAGSIESVTIYPSEFGLERMKIEAAEGPGKLIRESTGRAIEMTEHGEYDEEAAQEHLRAYELSKLRYYYAVVVCDSGETAEAIYEQTDGLEFEKSQNILDVRCVPDDVTFDTEPKDHCGELPAEVDFKLDSVHQSALAHSKVKLSWEDDDTDDRLVLKKRKFTDEELEKIDYSNYLASDNSSASEDENDVATKQQLFRGLIQECEEQEEAENPTEGELEITWAVGLKERTEALLAAREEREKEKTMTIGEKLEKKRREKKRARKQKIKELVAGKSTEMDEEDEEDIALRVGGADPYFQQDLTADFSDDETAGPAEGGFTEADAIEKDDEPDESSLQEESSAVGILPSLDDEDSRHFDMTKIIKQHRKAGKKGKRKGKKGAKDQSTEEDTFALNTKDGRFTAVFTDKDYSIDPTRPEFKKTREMDALIAERQRKVQQTSSSSHESSATAKSGDLGILVDKIRRSHPKKARVS